MIDWLSLTLPVPEHLQERVYQICRGATVIQKVDLSTGLVEWTAPCRESVRSDSHQITIQITPSRVVICGSPARSMGQDNNVFGSSDLRACARAHVAVARAAYPELALPGARVWRITRVDVTHNYDMGGDGEVRQALAYLRQIEGGRYRLDTRRESVYWSAASLLRSGKAYPKGPHLRFLVEGGKAKATLEQIQLAGRLLRLELKLGNTWWGRRRKAGLAQWQVDLRAEYEAYWNGLLGEERIEVADMSDYDRIRAVSKTEGQALATYRTWCVIKIVGYKEASESMRRSTWYAHKKILFAAGFNWGDLNAGRVIQLRKRPLVIGAPVESWHELRLAA